jgi:type III secretion system YscD/HrpQ family protein
MPAHLIGQEGPHKGLLLDLKEGQEWIIGRDPDEADLPIVDSTVSRKHARLTKNFNGIYLENLSKVNPTLINKEEIEEPTLLKEGDRVQIGNTVFLFSEKELPKETESPKKKKEKKKPSYDDIFGDMGEIEKEPTPEPVFEKEPEAPAPLAAETPEPTAYDTIFEETHNEEEIPFDLVSDFPLILKVISGPNAGAEIGIEKGRSYTIGKDPNVCDVVFQDLSVSRSHAKLTVSAEGAIEIEDLGSKNGTVVNGTPIAEKTAITTQDLVALGTTAFLVIDREAPQETIYSPMLPTYEVSRPSKPEETPSEAARDWKQEKIPTKHLILAGSFAAIFLIVFISFFSLFKSKGVELSHKEPTDQIKEALAKFDAVQFSYNPGSGKLFLVGHVLTNVDYQEMRYRVGEIPFIASTEDNVVIDEGVWRMMNDVLTENAGWRGVSIHSPAAGKFVVNGYIQTNAQGTELSDYLTTNFPYIDRLENKVTVEETLNTELQSLLMTHSFGAVTFQLANGEVVLSGKYSEKMEREYKELVKEINKTSGVQSVKDFAIAVSPKMASIDLTQQYQISGSSMFDGRGYSAVINGKIYTLGDQIDGMKISSIEPSTILLEKDGLKYKIDYAGGRS